jgi:hypothetical protein
VDGPIGFCEEGIDEVCMVGVFAGQSLRFLDRFQKRLALARRYPGLYPQFQMTLIHNLGLDSLDKQSLGYRKKQEELARILKHNQVTFSNLLTEPDPNNQYLRMVVSQHTGDGRHRNGDAHEIDRNFALVVSDDPSIGSQLGAVLAHWQDGRWIISHEGVAELEDLHFVTYDFIGCHEIESLLEAAGSLKPGKNAIRKFFLNKGKQAPPGGSPCAYLTTGGRVLGKEVEELLNSEQPLVEEPGSIDEAKKFVGIWKGTMQSPVGSFPVTIQLNEFVPGEWCGILEHPAPLDAAGKLRCIKLEGKRMTVDQTIFRGRERCLDGLSVLTLIDDDTMERVWIDPGTGNARDKGRLKRE